jgi:tetratricopeptide (TPR) repeat protein
VYATSRDRFEESFHLIAEALKIPGRADKDNDILQLVDAWLQKSTTGQWIIILDNADDPKVLKSISCSSSTSKKSNPRPLIDFVPRSINGAVLVTSRNKQAARDICGNTTLLDVEKMESSDAILLLQKKLPQDKVESAQEDKFAKLAEELDCIPLAMIHAAAYMTREDIDAKTYLELLQQSSTTMLNQKLEDMWRDTRIPHSVISTWQVSFQQIQAHNPQAIELLFLMSLLDRQSISEELTRGEFYAEPCNDAAEKLSKSWSLQEYVEACGLLLAFGFVSDLKTGEFRSFYMHRLVQSCVRHWMAISADTFYWELRALNLLARSFPHGFFGTWPKCAEFLPHAYQIMRSTTDSKYDGPEKACLLRNVANYERGQGHWDIAEKMITQSVAILQRLEHSDILESQRALARLLLEKGQYLAAESLALHVIERAVEPRLAASCKLVLANAMLEQGRYNDAIEILRPFVEATEIDSGPEKSFRLLCLPSFAVCLGQLGQYKEQGRICRPVLSARENSLGPRHHDTLLANLELATALSRQGEHKDAEKFRRQALSELKKILGIGHPTTLKLEANLAMDFVKEGKYAEAESLCRQVLKVQEMSLGPEQVGTLRTVDNLARAILSQGRHGEAEKLFERALIGKEKALGLDHPNTLRSAQNLAVALRDQGKYNEAEKLYRRALIGREKVLGPEHEDTLRSLRCLAFSLLRQDKHEEAEEHYQQALTGHETVLGLEHKDTMHCLRYLAFALSCQNKHKEAETVYQQALKRHEKVLGSDHENTLDCLRLLAFSQLRQDKLEEAEIVFQQAFMRHKKVLGLENKHTLWVLSGLDECKRQRVQKRKPIYDLRDRPGYEKRQRRSE